MNHATTTLTLTAGLKCHPCTRSAPSLLAPVAEDCFADPRNRIEMFSPFMHATRRV